MASKKRQPVRRTGSTRRSGSSSPAHSVPPRRSKRLYINIGAGVLAVSVLALMATLSSSTSSPTSVSGSGGLNTPLVMPVSQTEVTDTDRRKARTLDELLELTPDQRAEVDIARANLLVAKSTPGAEDINIDEILATLDQWAEAVAFDTDRHLYKFHADPGDYNNSEGYFRILSLITVLQQDCGVRYNPERISEPDFTNPGDLFIHGMVGGEGGTCVSMPVLYTAIARRLGYPVSLVTTKGHVFARWEEETGERFNIEATNRGLSVYDDEHYMQWPEPITADEIERYGFLKTLDADETVAVFLTSMGHTFADTGRSSEAIQAYHQAETLDPDNAMYAGFAGQVEDRQAEKRRRRDPAAELQQIHEMNRRMKDRMNNPTAPPP